MKYRKKPVVIDAVQWTGNNMIEMNDFIGVRKFMHITNDNSLLIPTLEGDHKALEGDFIIKGVAGEYYPCKPDIFEMTYDKVMMTYLVEVHRESEEQCNLTLVIDHEPSRKEVLDFIMSEDLGYDDNYGKFYYNPI